MCSGHQCAFFLGWDGYDVRPQATLLPEQAILLVSRFVLFVRLFRHIAAINSSYAGWKSAA